MRHLKVFLIVIIINGSLCPSPLLAQKLNSKQIEIIHTETFELLKSYESILNTIALNNSDEAVTAKLTTEFISLFLNRQVQIFNDLEPSHQFSEFYEVETYISNLLLWYPDGMRIHFDYSNMETPGIMPHKDNIWFMDVHAVKSIEGNYMNRTLNNNKEELYFRIAFLKRGKKVENFKLVGIRNSKSNTVATNEKALKELNKAEYSEEELIQVHQSAKSLLLDYSRSLELICNPNEPAEYKEYYINDFFDLFRSEDVRVFNDIDPKPENELIDVKSYIENLQGNYALGISNLTLNIDSAEFSHIERTDDGKYQTFVYVEKFFSGTFKDKQTHTVANPMIFTLSLEKTDGAFHHLTIQGIDKEYTEFTGITAIEDSNSEVLKALSPITKTGNWIGLSYMGGITHINSQNLNDLRLDANGHTWTVTPEYGYSVGLEYKFFFSDSYGFGSGLRYSAFNTNYTLSGSFQNMAELVDANSHLYISNITADLDSAVSLKYLSVPLIFNYHKKLNKRFTFYVSAGLNISFLYHSEYKLSGYKNDYGFYLNRTPALQIISFEELGFGNNDYTIPFTGKPDIKTLNLHAEFSFGFNIRTGYYSSVQFGPKILFGLSSVTNSDKYSDIFGNPHEIKPTRTNNIGFEISYIRKI